MKVTVYSGVIPSTTFIDRLIYGLADNDVKVQLHGRMEGKPKVHKNICLVGYRGRWSKISLVLKYGFLLIVSKHSLKPLLNKIRGINDLGAKLNFFVKTAPVVYFRPNIFHLQWASDIENWIFLQNYGIKIVCSLRGRLIYSAPLADPALKQIYLRCFPQVDVFHAVSDTIGFEAMKYGASREKIVTVYSGLRLSIFPYTPRYPNNSNGLTILSVGRADWKKGYSYALDACYLLKKKNIDFHYKIIGGIDEEMIFHIFNSGLSADVTVIGQADNNTVIREMNKADILLLPSVEEGIANVALEAMATGLPVLSTNCGGMPEVITDGVTGWLVTIRRPDLIADSLIRFRHINVTKRVEISTNARRKIEHFYTEKTMVDGMLKVYQRCL